LRELEETRAAAEAKLAELRAAGEDRWRELCRDLELQSESLARRTRELMERD
jgi:hypothetical protein